LQTRRNIPTRQDVPRRRRPVIVELPYGYVPGERIDYSSTATRPEADFPSGPLLKATEVAERLNVTPRWVTDKWNAGHLKGYRLPGSNRLRFDWPEILACLDTNGSD
jgi:hypothetical protein